MSDILSKKRRWPRGLLFHHLYSLLLSFFLLFGPEMKEVPQDDEISLQGGTVTLSLSLSLPLSLQLQLQGEYISLFVKDKWILKINSQLRFSSFSLSLVFFFDFCRIPFEGFFFFFENNGVVFFSLRVGFFFFFFLEFFYSSKIGFRIGYFRPVCFILFLLLSCSYPSLILLFGGSEISETLSFFFYILPFDRPA